MPVQSWWKADDELLALFDLVKTIRTEVESHIKATAPSIGPNRHDLLIGKFQFFFLFFIWIFNLETQKAAGDRFSRRFIELLINSDALREYGTYAKVKLVQKEELESPIAVNMPLKLSMSNTGSEQIFIRTVHERQHYYAFLGTKDEPEKHSKDH